MTFIPNRRIVATIATASCIGVPTTASASAGTLPPTYRTDGAQSGAAAVSAFLPADFHTGDSPADYPGASRAATAAPTAFHAGDTPAEYPGASRAPIAAPTTIEVARPERTIVRDFDKALPLILAGTTLLLMVAGLGITLVRAGIVPRPGRSH